MFEGDIQQGWGEGASAPYTRAAGGVEGGPVGSGCNHPGQRSRPVLQGTMTNTADDKCSHSGQTLKEKANSQV